jgi:hypothetical protein
LPREGEETIPSNLGRIINPVHTKAAHALVNLARELRLTERQLASPKALAAGPAGPVAVDLLGPPDVASEAGEMERP